jgi:uncharacterized membrane protein YfcA
MERLLEALCAGCGGILEPRLAAAALVVALAGLVRGFSGFGAALLWVIDGIGAIPYLPPHFRRADWRDVSLLAAGSLASMPFGTWVLTHGDPYWLRWGVCGTVLVCTLGLASGWRYRGKPSAAATVAVGAGAGFSNASVGIGGPPLVLFWLSGQTDAARARSNIFAYFAISSAIALTLYLWHHAFTARVALQGALLMPIYVGGLYFGNKLFAFGTETLFRRFAFGLCGLAALIGMPLWG